MQFIIVQTVSCADDHNFSYICCLENKLLRSWTRSKEGLSFEQNFDYLFHFMISESRTSERNDQQQGKVEQILQMYGKLYTLPDIV